LIVLIILGKSTNHEAPRYSVFSIIPSLHSSLVQIFSSVLSSQTSSFYIPLLMSETKFHTHIKPKEKYLFCNIHVFKQQTRR
jgi:hypothetical protein